MRSEMDTELDILSLLAEERADAETYAEQRGALLLAIAEVGTELSVNPYDFLDMIEEIKQLMKLAMVDGATVQ